MQRRKFLGLLAAIPALIPVMKGFAGIPEPDKDGYIYYRGYRIFWTGYKESQNNNLLIGQWVAYGPTREGPYYYACTTGCGGEYKQGDLFDITLLSDWETVTPLSSEAHKEAVKVKTYKHLLRVIK
jgi:hypothetical protein